MSTTTADHGLASKDISPELSFNSEPSGKAILMEEAQKVIDEYNRCLESEEKLLEDVKSAIMAQAEAMIKAVEESCYNNQMKMNASMQSSLTEINTKLGKLDDEEEELRNFSVGLAVLMGDLKGSVLER